MKPEMIEMVLQEILSEQKETNLINAQLAAYIKSLSDKINDLNKRIGNMSGVTNVEQSKLINKLEDYLKEVKSTVDLKETGVTHKRIFQFFPSLNIREYYQIYGNILKWFALFGIACLLICLIRDLLEKQGYL